MKEQADWLTMANGQHDRFHKETEYRKTLVKVNCLFLALGTLENILVCLVMSRVYKARASHSSSKLSSFFTLHLAITDLIFRAVSFFRYISHKERMELSTGECKLTIFSSYTCAGVTFILLAAIAIDRYIHILFPIRSLRFAPKTYVALLFIWIYAILVCSGFLASATVSGPRFSHHRHRWNTNESIFLNLIGNKTLLRDYSEPPRHCIPGTSLTLSRQISFTIYFLFAFVVPLLCIVICYGRIIIFLWRKAKTTGMVNRYTAKAKLRAIVMFVKVFLSFLISWGPVMILDMIVSYTKPESTRINYVKTFPARPLFNCITLTSSIFNPIIYAFGDASFRRNLRLLLRFRKRRSMNVATVCPARQNNDCVQMTALNPRVSQ